MDIDKVDVTRRLRALASGHGPPVLLIGRVPIPTALLLDPDKTYEEVARLLNNLQVPWHVAAALVRRQR